MDKSGAIFAGVVNNVQQELITEKDVGLHILQEQVINLTTALSIAQDDLRKKEVELEEAEESAEHYKDLLCKPMAEIAAQNGKFRETYEKQMELMAEWMVSQKAFKELAIQFGFEKGISAEKVIEMGNSKKIDVLDSKHDESHGTNASAVPFIASRTDKLKDKISSKR